MFLLDYWIYLKQKKLYFFGIQIRKGIYGSYGIDGIPHDMMSYYDMTWDDMTWDNMK